MLDVLWIDLCSGLPDSLADYPSNLARDCIVAALRDAGFSLFLVTPEKVLLAVQSEPKILLFSATTPEWPQAVSIASQVRSVSPQSILVVGGHHVSALPYGIGTEFFDYVVVGEGEESIVDIVNLRKKRNFSLQHTSKPQIIRAKRIRYLDMLSTPLRDPDEIRKNRLRGLMFPAPSTQTGAAALLLSRGCNNQCTFCASHLVWGSELITRSAESASLEIRSVVDELRCNALVFVDQAFGEDKNWTKEICSRLQSFRLGERARWYCMAKTSLDIALLNDMASAGCSKIGFGVETADPQMRKAIKHEIGDNLESLNRLFRACNELGIMVKIYFMIGFPWETREYLMETTRNFLEKIRANELKISFFTPFPKTLDWERYKTQLMIHDWADFDTVRMPVVHNPEISVPEYHEIRKELFRAFYGAAIYADVTRKIIRAYPEYAVSFRDFADYLHKAGIIENNEAWLDKAHQEQAWNASSRREIGTTCS